MPGFRFCGKSKGFTLFTALVSFLLIALSMLLVQGMIKSEGNTRQILADLREQAEMEAVADLARADSLEVFNYGLRYHMENYFIQPANFYPLRQQGIGDWGAIEQDFAYTYFGACPPAYPSCKSQQFAAFLTGYLLSLLSTSTNFGNYAIKIGVSDQPQLQASVQAMLVQSAGAGDFFEVIGCASGEFSNCKGSFYINLDTAAIPDADYEQLPMITVASTATGRAVQKPVIARGTLRLYMPLRTFKAIAGANTIAQELYKPAFRAQIGSLVGSDAGAVKSSAKGIIEPKINNMAGQLSHDGMALMPISPADIDVRAEDGGSGNYKVSSISVKVVFQETNPDYMVDDTHAGTGVQKYTMQIADSSYSAP